MPVRAESLRELVYLQKKLNSLLAEMLLPSLPAVPSPGYAWVPPTDIYEDEEAYHVEIELPGIDLGDLELVCRGSSIRIAGLRGSARDLPRASIQRIERYSGPFEREFQFPSPVEESGIQALLSGGVLSLTIPKKRSRRKIRVD